MTTRRLDFPVFDADNHLYETADALTKYLPEAHKGAIDFVEVHGRTKIMVNGQVSNYIPNPTFDRGRPARRAGGVLQTGQPGGASRTGRSSAGASTAPRRSAQPVRAWSSWTSRVSTTP